MKVVLVNTNDTGGGAAIACRRLLSAHVKNGVDVKMLVRTKNSKDNYIESTTHNGIKRLRNNFNFLYERLGFIAIESSKDVRFAFSSANIGEDISDNKLIKEADLIHLHWVNQGFISLQGIDKLLKLNKPVVWTLHDMWAFTGGCHYSGTCLNYGENCGNCYFLDKPSENDISAKIWNKKKSLYENKNITFVTCSNWLKETAKRSTLLKDFRIESIPNPIDTDKFSPGVHERLVEKLNLSLCKKYILFGAANVNDKRKGLNYFIEALNILNNRHPESVYKVELLVFGKSVGDIFNELPYKLNNMGVMKSQKEIAEIYSVSNLFVLPSIEDNLPNTIMESLACGTAVVAFNTGGIPEMIENGVNGYLAEYKSSESLADNIYKVLFESDSELLCRNARDKVMSTYTESNVSNKYLDLYNEIIK
ncbi:MAG: glycosyltransferase [Bacteroidota bacterium]|nr:glycosyltransferase [Bacteroidota bacterium]